MKIELTDDTGTVHDVTEAVQIIYDTVHMGMEFGSGMLDTEEVLALRALSDVAGWEPVEYGLDPCRNCGHHRQSHRGYGDRRCHVIDVTTEEHTGTRRTESYPWQRGTVTQIVYAVGEPGPCGCSTFVLDRGREVER